MTGRTAALPVYKQRFRILILIGRQSLRQLQFLVSLLTAAVSVEGNISVQRPVFLPVRCLHGRLELAEALPPDQDQNPETLFIDRERVEYLEGQIDRELSGFEKQVLDLYLTGMSYSQIAKVLGREEKSTDNALQRLKSKIKKML